MKLGVDVSRQEKMENGIIMVLIRSLEKKRNFTVLSLRRSWHEVGCALITPEDLFLSWAWTECCIYKH